MKNIYVVILCGGHGTRLWPLSRKDRPKPLLPFLNNTSLLEQTIDRIQSITNKKNIGIITSQAQAKLIPQSITSKIGFVLEEPVARNTAPAVLYSCLHIKDPDAIAVFLSADHFIPETDHYCSYLTKAIEHAAATNTIVTLGLMPTHPATGYGYVQADAQHISVGTPYSVKAFHEKPNKEKAKKYVAQGDMFWNLGMFVGSIQSFLKSYQAHAPDMYRCVHNFLTTNTGYEQATPVSIDYAIMEKANNISLIPCDFIWNDVGNLDTFLTIQNTHGSPTNKETIYIDSTNNVVKTSKKVVCIGVKDLCIVEDGDVLVIAHRNDVEKVKEVI